MADSIENVADEREIAIGKLSEQLRVACEDTNQILLRIEAAIRVTLPEG